MKHGEYVYINGGEIYKQNIYFSGNDKSKFNYIGDHTNDPIGSVGHIKDEGTKIYKTTKEMRKWFGIDSGESITGHDLCPDVTLWCGKGYFTNGVQDFDLYFRVDSSAQLQNIADYYNLPYPINYQLSNDLDNNYNKLSMYYNGNEYITLGGIKFINNQPNILKMYCIIKENGNESLLQKGTVYANNGSIIEQGGQYKILSNPNMIYKSTSENSISTSYEDIKYNISEGDPFMSWKATITDASTGIEKTKFYESSKTVRRAIANYNIGSDFEDYDKSPNINYWLGRSYIEDGETELFFNAEDSDMLDEVCSYYNLPVPYNDDVKELLNNNRSLIRFKSYDLNRLGEGNFVELVVAGVVFENNQATQIKLYTNRRWNE